MILDLIDLKFALKSLQTFSLKDLKLNLILQDLRLDLEVP